MLVSGVDTAAAPSVVPVLPDHHDAGTFHQLLLQLDSCSIGRAAAFFAKNHVHAMISTHWGEIHASVRDGKRSGHSSIGSDIERALLQRTHTYSIHSKPFGSGVWHSLLKMVMRMYVDARDSTCRLFRFYGELWAKDLRARGEHIALDCDADWEVLWIRFQSILDTTVDPPKLSRWYNIMEKDCYKGTLFWSIKLVLTWYLEITATRP